MSLLTPLLVLVLALVMTGCAAVIGARVEREFPATGQFVSLPGGRLHFVEQKPASKTRGTVVLVHGASSNHADLLTTLGQGLKDFRVLAFDRPGQGWSDRLGGREMAQPDAQARAIASALDLLKTGPVILVAHSLAGGLATSMALDRPDLVEGLVLLSAVTHPWPGGIEWYYTPASAPIVGPVFTWLVAVPAAAYVLDNAARSVFAPSIPPDDYIKTAQIPLILRPSSFEANAQDVSVLQDFVTRQVPRYPGLKAPLVAIATDSDSVVSPTIHSAAIAREVPNGRLVIIKGAGHMPHHKGRDRVVAEIRRLADTLQW